MTRSSLTIRLLAVSAIAPLVVAGVGIALMLDWLPQASRPVVVHWGVSGVSYGPAVTYPATVAILVVALVVLLSALLAGTVRAGRPSVQQKAIAVVPVWLSVFLTGSAAWLLYAQLDSRTLTNPAPMLLIGAGAGVVLAVGAWFLLPGASPLVRERDRVPVPARAVAATEKLVWLGQAAAAPALVVALVALAVIMLVAGIVGALFYSPSSLLLLVPAVIIAFATSTLDWHVSIDERGLVARSLFGFPRFRVPLDEVSSASVVELNPLVDFGGWGIRFGLSKRTGIVMGSGEALEVFRRPSGSLVISLHDARGAAEVLAGLVARAGTSSAR